MQITKISASVRYSRDIGGAWKSVELSAEAALDHQEDWYQSQAELYTELGQQLPQPFMLGVNHRFGEVAASDSGLIRDENELETEVLQSSQGFAGTFEQLDPLHVVEMIAIRNDRVVAIDKDGSTH